MYQIVETPDCGARIVAHELECDFADGLVPGISPR
jgi:hypothetical protein